MTDTRPFFTKASADEMSSLRAAKSDWSEKLLRPRITEGIRARSAAVSPAHSHNVVGVGIGEKIADNQPTGIRALKFFVRLKYPESQLDKKNRLPKMVAGLPVDVEEVGVFRRLPTATRRRRPRPVAAMPDPRARIRPAQPGCSIGFREPNDQFVMAGTFGALVKKGDSLCILSNNHVIADENRLPIGSPIFQPGLLDRGRPVTDQIAELTKAIKLRNSGSFNKVDAAIATLLRNSLVTKEILFIGAPRGSTRARDDMIVHKFGRTTSYRVGRVTSIETDVTVEYDTGNFMFEDQIIIVGLNGQSFSDAGDSGSLILERESQQAIGLLFAGSASHTIANHIGDVLQALDVTLA